MKICTKCKQEKHEDEFYRNKIFSDGRLVYCKSCCSEYDKNYRKTKKYITYQRNYHREYRKGLGKEKINVRQVTSCAVRRGEITPKPCEICGNKAEKHHPDYSKPLKIIWLCRKHHAWLHRQFKMMKS